MPDIRLVAASDQPSRSRFNSISVLSFLSRTIIAKKMERDQCDQAASQDSRERRMKKTDWELFLCGDLVTAENVVTGSGS